MQRCNLLFALLLLVNFSSYGSNFIHVVTEDWPPFNYIDKSGEIAGSSTQVVKKVLDKANIEYDIRLYPWARSYEMALSNDNTLIYSILRTPNREKLFKWVCPISGEVNLFLYKLKKRNGLTINNIEEAKNYNIGVTRNDFPHVRLKQLGFKDAQLFLSPKDKSNIIMLLNERIDFVVESKETMETVLTETQFSMADVVPVIPLNTQVENVNCMAFSLKTEDKIVESVRQALKEYNATYYFSGEFKALANRPK